MEGEGTGRAWRERAQEGHGGRECRAGMGGEGTGVRTGLEGEVTGLAWRVRAQDWHGG